MKVKITKKKRITRKKGMKIIKGGGNSTLLNKIGYLGPQRTFIPKVQLPIAKFTANYNNIFQKNKKPLTFAESYDKKLQTCEIPNKENEIKVPFNCFGKEIYEFTNQSIGIQYDKNQFDYYTISPVILSVPTMQLALETDSISIQSEYDNDNNIYNYYLGFKNNFPSLVIQQTYNYAYTTRPLKTTEKPNIHETRPPAKWFNVSEDKDTFIFKDKHFVIIEEYKTSDDNKKVIEYDSANNARSPLNDLIKEKYYGNSYEEFKKNYKNIYISNTTNLEAYEYLIDKVRNIITSIKTFLSKTRQQSKENKNQSNLNGRRLPITLDDFLFERKLAISRVVYRTYINLNGKTEYIIENIRWVVENALWLEKYLELKNKWSTKLNKYNEIDELLTNQHPEYKELQHPMYESDLSGLDSRFFIVDDDNKEYVIVGYPEKQMKQHILNFWQEENQKNEQNVVKFIEKFKALNKDNSRHIAELFNKFIEEKIKKSEIKEEEKIKEYKFKHQIQNEFGYYKLYMNLRQSIFDYIKKRYVELNQKDKSKVSDDELKNFNANFESNANKYFQQIALKYVPKPMTFIKYVFLVFTKKEGKLNPMIFNVKELKAQHVPILKKIERLIKHELPYRFGVLSPDEYNKTGLGNDANSQFDDEYKLFYSRYRYGKFFHISTELTHTILPFSGTAHNYQNSITLEELTYACGLNSNSGNSGNSTKPFFEDIQLNYQVREHQINNYIINHKDYTVALSVPIPPNRSQKVFSLYEEKKEEDKINELQKLFEADKANKLKKITTDFETWEKDKDKNEKAIQTQKIQAGFLKLIDLFRPGNKNYIRFIILFKAYHNTYTFIYSYKNEDKTIFYKLVIESSISKILDDIIVELNKKLLSNNFNDMVIKFMGENKCFKIISNDELDDHDYKEIFEKNPFIVIKIQQIPKTLTLDLSYYYETALLTPKSLGTFVNFYTQTKQYIYTNNIIGKQYIEGFKKYIYDIKNNKPLNLDCNILTYEDKYTNCDARICSSSEVIINCAYYNIGNSGYDIIESIDNSSHKIVLYIVRHNYNYKNNFITNPDYKTKYLGNFLDLDSSSLSILTEIKKKYSNDDYVCFLHNTKTLRFYCLHCHIIKKEYYKRNYPKTEIGIFMIQDMFIDEVINNLISNINYYKMINYNLLKST